MICHDVDLLHFYCGEIPESVYTIGHCYDPTIAKYNDVDTCVVTLKYPSGLLATIDCSRTAAYQYDQRVELFGEGGMVQVENERESTVILANADGYATSPNKFSFPQRYEKTYRVEMEYFVREMVLPWRTEPEAEIRRHVLLERVVTAAEWSLKRGRPVLISEVDEERKHGEVKH
jgi:myo-inositol 2-dehydrogenase/D-chiro-inositol 1-dehydrogenase